MRYLIIMCILCTSLLTADDEIRAIELTDGRTLIGLPDANYDPDITKYHKISLFWKGKPMGSQRIHREDILKIRELTEEELSEQTVVEDEEEPKTENTKTKLSSEQERIKNLQIKISSIEDTILENEKKNDELKKKKRTHDDELMTIYDNICKQWIIDNQPFPQVPDINTTNLFHIKNYVRTLNVMIKNTKTFNKDYRHYSILKSLEKRGYWELINTIREKKVYSIPDCVRSAE